MPSESASGCHLLFCLVTPSAGCCLPSHLVRSKAQHRHRQLQLVQPRGILLLQTELNEAELRVSPLVGPGLQAGAAAARLAPSAASWVPRLSAQQRVCDVCVLACQIMGKRSCLGLGPALGQLLLLSVFDLTLSSGSSSSGCAFAKAFCQ